MASTFLIDGLNSPLLLTGGFGGGVSPVAPWYNAAWAHRLAQTIDNTANATSALSYYQAAVSLTGAAYTAFHAHAKSDGSDIRVTDSDGTTPLSFALEGIDTANSVVYLLVKVPRVAAASSRTIFVYYGNPSASSISSYATTVGPTTALVGPTDVYTQTDKAGVNGLDMLVVLKNQGGAHGGGSSLNGNIVWIKQAGALISGGGSPIMAKLISTDGGTTWTKSVLLTPATSFGCTPRALSELADGTLLFCYVYDTDAHATNGFQALYIAKSVNGGATWSNLSTSPTNTMTLPWTYLTDIGTYGTGMFVEPTPGGDIFLPAYSVIGGIGGTTRTYLMKCPSGGDPAIGSNWVLQGTIMNDGVSTFNETAVANTTDTTHWIAVARNDTPASDGDFFFATSADNGVTWTAPAAMKIPGTTSPGKNPCSPIFYRLASGTLVLGFGARHGTLWGAGFLASTDNGATWLDRAPAMPGNQSSSGQDTRAFGYPTIGQRADGVLVAAWYHEVGSNVDTANSQVVMFTEDYLFNANNVYEGCEALTNFSHGANATISTTHVHNGTNAIEIDNSAGTGGIGDWVLANIWSTNPAQHGPRLAISRWSYETANDSSRAMAIKDSTGVFNSATGNRISQLVLGTTSDHITWFDGTSHHDTGVACPANQWTKIALRAATLPTSVTGEILLNNVSLTTGLGQSGSGGNPQMVLFQGGSVGSTHNVTFWLDDVYTHQYAANTPAITSGSEENAPTVPTTATLSGPTTGRIGVASTNFTVTLDNVAVVDSSFPVTYAGGSVATSPVVVLAGQTTATFTVTPSGLGASNVSIGAGTTGLAIAGSPISYNATATTSTATLSGPSTGHTGSASTNFTITLDVSALADKSFPITYAGGSVTTSPVVVLAGQTTATFTVTPSSSGTSNVTLGAGSTGLSILGSPIAYTASAIAAGATLSGPPSGPIGSPSTAFTITLDGAAPVGGVSCPVSSSNGADTVTTSPVVIASGQTSGTFTVSAVGAGVRNITLGATTPSLVIAGSPVVYLATAGPTPPSGGSSVLVLGIGVY